MLYINYLGFRAKNALHKFIKKENGDTNFISIIIILAIVMVVAAIFIGFREQIVNWVQTTFSGAFNDVQSKGGAGGGAGGAGGGAGGAGGAGGV